MINQAYQDAFEDDQAEARNVEHEIIMRSIQMMIDSDQNPDDSSSRLEAIYFINRLWSILLDNLASPDNEHSKELRASLISIGIFILKHIEKMRHDNSRKFEPIREISESIAKGIM